jgi:hypothetical protein
MINLIATVGSPDRFEGLQALGETRKQAVDELKKRAALQIQAAKVERAWWDEP